jgi:PAS domain S-box-containing protein
MSKNVILVVEDDFIEAMDIKKILESAGYNVSEIVATGEEALKNISKSKPDLILMDFILKVDKNGIETAEIIKKRYKIPVIYLTAHSENFNFEKTKITDPYAYLIRPFDSNDLIRTIDNALNKNKIEKELEDSKEHFKNLFENSPIGIFHSSTEGKFYMVNKALSNMWGYDSTEDLITQVNKTNINEKLYVDSTKRRNFVHDVLKDDKWHSYKNRFYKKDGSIMTADLSFRAVKDENFNIEYLEGFVKDVTRETEAEIALNKSESRYQLISENTGDVIWIMEIDSWKFNYISPSAYHLTGYTQKNLMKKSIRDIIKTHYPEDISKNLHQRIDLLKTGDKSAQVMVNYVNIIHKNGGIVPTEVVTTLLIDENGDINEILGVSRDITERKESEKKIREIMQKNEYAMAISKMANWELDVKKCIFSFNPRFYMMLGITFDDVGSYQMEMDDFIQTYAHPDFIDKLNDAVIQGMESDDPYFQIQIEGKLKRSNGEVFWVNTWFRGEKDDNGNTIRLHGVNQDITERKIIEKSLIESEDKYKTLFEADPNYTILIDIDRFIMDVNAATISITGLSKEKLIGKHLNELDIILEEDKVQHIGKIIDLLDGNKVKPFEARLIDKNGNLRWVNVRLISIEKDNVISYILIIASDITELKKYENEIQDSLHEKEILLQEIHHRVKNNMQIISSLLSIQTRYVDDEESINVLKESQNRVKSLAMIHEKLYKSKNFNKIYLLDYIESLVWDLFYSYGIEKGRIKPILDIDDVKLNIETSVPCGLIITELVSNCLKYAFPDQREGKLEVTLKIVDDFYELTICDNGVGIPEDIDFFNTDSLGLQLVNSLTDQIDGKIEFDRSNGTKFTIIFKELIYKDRF